MSMENAEKIILDNYNCNENSFAYCLHEKCCFSIEKFWEFYDSIAAFVDETEKNPEITRYITHTYQQILKEIIYHFDPNDFYVIDSLPDNYPDYIDRIDLAILAYYTDNADLLDDDKFESQRKS